MRSSSHSLFSRHRTSSVERELSRTPYAFTPKPRIDPEHIIDPGSFDEASIETIRQAKERILDPFEDDINVRLAKERLFGGYSRNLSRAVSPTIFPSNDDFGKKLNKIEREVENDLFGQNVSFDALSNISERLSETSSIRNFDQHVDDTDHILELEKKLNRLPTAQISLPNRNIHPDLTTKPPPRKLSDISRASSEKSFKRDKNLNPVILDQNKNHVVSKKNIIIRQKTADDIHIKRMNLARNSQDSLTRSSDNSESVELKNSVVPKPPLSKYQQSRALAEIYTDRFYKSISLNHSGSSFDSDNNSSNLEYLRSSDYHQRVGQVIRPGDNHQHRSDLVLRPSDARLHRVNPILKPSDAHLHRVDQGLRHSDHHHKGAAQTLNIDNYHNREADQILRSTDHHQVPGTDGAFKILAPPASASVDLESMVSDASSYKVQPTGKPHRNTAFAILGEVPPSSAQLTPSIQGDTASTVSLSATTGRVSPFRGKGFKPDLNSRHTTPRPSRNTSPQRSRANSFSKAEIAPKVQTRLNYHRSPTPARDYIKENIEEVKELSEFNREMNILLAEQKKIDEELEILRELGVLDNKGLLRHGTNLGDLYSRSGSPTDMQNENGNVPSSKISYSEFEARRRSSTKVNYQNMSKSQPQSKTGSPLHSSRIPKRTVEPFSPLKERAKSNLSPSKMSNKINPGGRFISNSTGSIHEKRVFSVLPSDSNDESYEGTPRSRLRNSQQINAKSKSPGRLGPPPTRGNANSKRLSPIESTPDKSPSSTKSGRVADSRSRTPLSKAPSTTQLNKRGARSQVTSPDTSRAPSRAGGRAPSRAGVDAKGTPIRKATSTSRIGNDNRGTNKAPMKKGYSRSTNSIESSDNEGKPPFKRMSSKSSIVSSVGSGKPDLRRQNSKTSLMSVKPAARTNSMKSMKGITELAGVLRRKPSLKNLQEKSGEEVYSKGKGKDNKGKGKSTRDQEEETDAIPKQDNETQYDKLSQIDISMDKLIPLTKSNIVSMTTAAITAQPLEIAAKVTSQLPATFEKAREKRILDRNSSSDSMAAKALESKDGDEDGKDGDNKLEKTTSRTSMLSIKEEKSNMIIHDNVKLKPLSDSQLDPKVEKVKQKIDNILKSTSSSVVDLRDKVSNEGRLSADKVKQTLENVTEKVEGLSKTVEEGSENAATTPSKTDSAKTGTEKDKEKRPDSASSRTADQVKKAISKKIMDEVKKNMSKDKDAVATASSAFMSAKTVPKSSPAADAAKPKVEASTPKVQSEPKKEESVKKESLMPSVTVVNEPPSGVSEAEETTQQIVRGDPDVEVQSGNMSMSTISDKKDKNFNDTHPKVQEKNKEKEKEKEKLRGKSELGESSKQGIVTGSSNGAGNTSKLPQSEPKGVENTKTSPIASSSEANPEEEKEKTKTGCGKFFGGISSKLPCVKRDHTSSQVELINEKAKKKTTTAVDAEKKNAGKSLSKLNCFSKNKSAEPNISIVPKSGMAQNNADVEKGKWTNCMACCRGKNKVRDSSQGTREANTNKGWRSLACCCKSKEQKDEEWAARRDSILSQSPPPSWWQRALCCKKSGEAAAGASVSRKTSMFSKKRSLSQAVPIEDKRFKLDPSLVEHGSLIRGAIPALPIPLAWICFVCNILIPGLGTLCSGMFCLCFGRPRFSVNDGWKPRIGAFVIDVIVGVGQLFTVMFCLVGWGWSIWWATIMIRVARKFKKMKAAHEAEPPATSTNNNRINHA